MFSPSWKIVFKQSRHLLNTLSICRDLQLIVIAISTPLDSKVDWSRNLLSPQYLLDPSSFGCCGHLPGHLSIAESVEAFKARHLPQYLSTPRFVENYWTPINRFQRNPILIFSISLDLSMPIHLPNTLFSLKTFNPRDFRPFLASNRLVWSLFLSLFMHFMHLNLGFGVFEKFWGFFKIIECLLKFWDGFLFKWSLNLTHCITHAL